jgi:hypothetical protein
MKQRVLLGLVVVFCGLVVGCATAAELAISVDLTPTKFEGAWAHLTSPNHAVFVFRGNSWKLVFGAFDKNMTLHINNRFAEKGTFTFDDDEITLHIEQSKTENQSTRTHKYSFVENTLMLDKYINKNNRTEGMYGRWTKQD